MDSESREPSIEIELAASEVQEVVSAAAAPLASTEGHSREAELRRTMLEIQNNITLSPKEKAQKMQVSLKVNSLYEYLCRNS